MKKLVLLLGAFALIGCGEKEKSPNSVQTDQGAAAVQEAKEDVEAVSSGPEPLISDADVERFAKSALNPIGSPRDYTGWIASYFDKAETQIAELAQLKDGEGDGPSMIWYDTGKIKEMSMWKSGERVSFQAFYPTGEKQTVISSNDAGLQEGVSWHKNGQKAATVLMKDGAPLMKEGEPVAMKFWNEEGEELDQEEGMKMMEQLHD